MIEEEGSSGSSNSDSDSSDSIYNPKKPSKLMKWKPLKLSVGNLELSPQMFIDCDLTIFDGLGIKGWEKFKAQLEEWKIGKPWASLVEARPIRGMSHELMKWVALIKLFSRCSLSFYSDKLVAISGMAQTLAPALNCDYLAGLWRKDLEHQLLWKVTQPRPAPEKSHTRGPSWTWASVDGAIEIQEWRGYFYDRIPGDITWMAKVGNASVRLGEIGRYGHVRSGHLTLTGRLGVFRIINNEPEISVNTNENPGIKRPWVRAFWDTQELTEKFGTPDPRTYVKHHSTYGAEKGIKGSMDPRDIFFAPVRVMDSDPDGSDYEQPMLTGLLLLPTNTISLES
ncbi:HET-domain-containing protein [Fusarium austroafricanum]|uniref:HET-domain-containing protein n=1 Tax=Fusarium austroafricanum TaxID=2364996 RepID=A0A8H4JXL7_9HYPO|nr:HET-domain-containing protein [Fusarium austroafricanum]